MKEKQIQDELASIRSLMERSSKFISLSGLSGILAGVYALIGAAVTYYFHFSDIIFTDLTLSPEPAKQHYSDVIPGGFYVKVVVPPLFLIALLVLAASLITGLILTRRKAKMKGQNIWGSTSRALLFQMAIPLVTGGILILIFINRGYYGIVAPASLIFYGLSLISASSYTFRMIKYLGLCEIVLGLIAACLPGYGLLFWAIGFGVLHIVYGSMMYFKYDR